MQLLTLRHYMAYSVHVHTVDSANYS